MNTTNKKEKPVYTQSDEVAAAKAALGAAEGKTVSPYTSKYGKTISDIADRIVAGEKFSYDFNADPIYNVYREQAERDRRRAVSDAAASAAALTGGYANSYGATAAAEASAKTYDSLRALIPSLAEAAYKKWYNDKKLENETLSSIMALEDADYSRWRDEVKDYNDERAYLAGRYNDLYAADVANFKALLDGWYRDRDYDRSVYEYDTDAAYRAQRDAVEDAIKERELALEAYKVQNSNAARAAQSASSEGSGKTEKKEETKNIADILAGMSSKTAKSYASTLLNGNVVSRTSGEVSSAFVSKIESAKKNKLIDNTEYNKFWEVFRIIGISGN